MPVTRGQVVTEARSWINTPFHHHSCIKNVGVDCVHLPIGVCKSLGLGDYQAPDYGKTPDGFSLLSICDQNLIRISQQEMKPGDIVVISVDKDPQHVGIIGDYRRGLSIIHACNARSVVPPRVIETRLMFSRAMTFVAAYQIPGVE